MRCITLGQMHGCLLLNSRIFDWTLNTTESTLVSFQTDQLDFLGLKFVNDTFLMHEIGVLRQSGSVQRVGLCSTSPISDALACNAEA